MNFKINKKVLLEKLNISSKAISSSVPVPSLTCIKIDAKDNQIMFTSSDSNVSIKTILDNSNDFEIIDEGTICLDAKKLIECVRKSETETLDFEVLDGTLTQISYGTVKFRINGINSFDYPNIVFNDQLNYFYMKTSEFVSIISNTGFAIAVSDNRPCLKGINFKLSAGNLVCTATDSYRLARKEVKIEDFDEEFNIVVPKETLSHVSSIILNEDTLKIALDDKKMYFVIGNNIIQTKLIDDHYPDTSRIIPTDFEYSLTINSNSLLKGIDRTLFVKSEGKSIIRMDIKNGELLLSTRSQDNDGTEEHLTYDSYTGEELTLSCSGNYLMDAIKAIDSDLINIKFVGPLKPFIIRNNNDDSILQLVSPVRTYD